MRRSVDAFADMLDELQRGLVVRRFDSAQHDVVDAGQAGHEFGTRALREKRGGRVGDLDD